MCYGILYVSCIAEIFHLCITQHICCMVSSLFPLYVYKVICKAVYLQINEFCVLLLNLSRETNTGYKNIRVYFPHVASIVTADGQSISRCVLIHGRRERGMLEGVSRKMRGWNKERKESEP